MKTQYIIVAIVILAVLVAFSTPAMAQGCPFSNFYDGTLHGGIYFDVKGHYDDPGVTQTEIFENVPDGRGIVRFYPGIWLGSPYPGRVTYWNITINGHTDNYNFTEPGSLPFCEWDIPPEDGAGEHCTVSCTGCGQCSVTYNASAYVVTGDNTITFWTSEQIDQFALLVVYENESMQEMQYWIKEGHEYPDSAPYYVDFDETGNTGPIEPDNISSVEYYTYGYPHCPGESGWPYLNDNYIGSPNITKYNGYAPVFYGWTDLPPGYIASPTNSFRYPTLGNDRLMVPVLALHYEEIVETYTIDGYIFKDGVPQPNPKVNITNLANGKEWAASIDGNFYNLTLTPGVDVNASETLQIVACEELGDYECNCNVSDITATIPGGDHNVNLTLNHYCLNWYPRYPYYTWEQENWSGPAVMEMCIDNYRDPPYVPNQTELNETGIGNNYGCNSDLPYVDTHGMWTTLNHYLHEWQGQPYVANYYRTITDDRNNALHYLCWYQSLGPGVAPAYSDYSNWMVVRGIHTNVSPRTAGYSGYDIYGFWINDPNPTGIGENTYKTVDQWNGEYYFNLIAINENDPCYGKYVAVCEPPEHGAEVRPVPAKPRLADAITPAMIEKLLEVYGIEQLALERAVKDDEALKIVKAAIDGVTEELIPYDTEFAEIFARTTAGVPMLVTDDGGDYYVVPFNVPVIEKPVKKVPIEIEKVKISGLNEFGRVEREDEKVIIKPVPIEPIKQEKTLVVVIVDATDGSFKEASWVADAVKYLPVSKVEALKLALTEIDITSANELTNLSTKPTIELVYRNASPYYPDWKITVDGDVYYVSQDGTVSS